MEFERVAMADLKEGDIVWTDGVGVRISGGEQHVPRPGYGDTVSWFHGDIVGGTHPLGWQKPTWSIQSADWVMWWRERR